MQRPLSVLRVFTRDGVGGNRLGVVTELDDLSGESMQLIATDLGISETIFIDMSGEDVPTTRIFTPAMEMPFAGHPLVGAAWSILHNHQGTIDRLRCGIGEVKIRLEADLAWVDAPMFPANAQRTSGAFALRVGLPEPVGAWQVKVPLDYRLVELATAAEVAVVAPDTTAFGNAHGLTVFARDSKLVRMRFFIPEAGIDEDPATGSAAVALATMWAASGEKSGQVVIHQGEEIGHPSRINLQWAGAVASIGGTVVEDEIRELTT